METTTKLIIQQANEFIEALELLKTLNLPDREEEITLPFVKKDNNGKWVIDYDKIEESIKNKK